MKSRLNFRIWRSTLWFFLLSLSMGVLVSGQTSLAEPDENQVPQKCTVVLSFPMRSTGDGIDWDLLPEPLLAMPPNPGLRHLLQLATLEKKQAKREKKSFAIPLELIDPKKLSPVNYDSTSEKLKIPNDFLGAEELDRLRPIIKDQGLEDVFSASLEIPLITTHLVPKVSILAHMQLLAITEQGLPVLLEHLPVRKLLTGLSDRANAVFVLAGLKRMSDRKILPQLLGITQIEDGSFMAVFPIPAGFESITITGLKRGMAIAAGTRGTNPEPFAKEEARIQAFEDLLSRLIETHWPLLEYSLDFTSSRIQELDLRLSPTMEMLNFPLWESQNGNPFFYPYYFAIGGSSWFPAPFERASSSYGSSLKDHLEFSPYYVVGTSNNSSDNGAHRHPRVQLEKVDPKSKFGRITLLRFHFFDSLANGQAKVSYLNLISQTSPTEHANLIELIEFLAPILDQPKLSAFISKYKARKFREAFQVIDGKAD